MEISTPQPINNSLSRELRTWIHTFLLSLLIVDLWLMYQVVGEGTITLSIVSTAIAATGGTLIGMSFALSGICYYFNFLDRQIYFRKYLGVIGYFYALLYSILLLYVDSERYLYGFFENIGTLDFILGLTVMSILTFMTAISNSWAMKVLGHYWRMFLRFGYLAYLLLIIRAIIMESDVWYTWLLSLDGLPPVRMLLSLFASSVIILRIILEITKRLKPKPQDTYFQAVPKVTTL